jgi:hypothetical protein
MLDDERHEPGEIFVRLQWRGRKMGAPLTQFEGITTLRNRSAIWSEIT